MSQSVNFAWPRQQPDSSHQQPDWSHQEPHWSHQQPDWPNHRPEPNPEGIVTTVKNIMTSLINDTKMDIGTTIPKDTISEAPPTPPTIVGNEFTEQAAETTQNILTTVADTMTNTARNIFTTVSNSIESATPTITTGNSFNLTANAESNSTVFTEILGSNNTMEESGTTIDSMLDNITTESNIATQTMSDIVTTTTEKIIGMTNTTTYSKSPEHMYQDDSVIVYVVLGVLLGILILIFIALLVFYRKYKKCRQTSGDYCVTQLKEISSSSIKTTSDLEGVHVKH